MYLLQGYPFLFIILFAGIILAGAAAGFGLGLIIRKREPKRAFVVAGAVVGGFIDLLIFCSVLALFSAQ